MPTSRKAAISSEVATGRRMKGVEMLMRCRPASVVSAGSAAGLGRAGRGAASCASVDRDPGAGLQPGLAVVTTIWSLVEALAITASIAVVLRRPRRPAAPPSGPASRHRRRGRPGRAAPRPTARSARRARCSSSSRALTNWPGQSLSSRVGERRLQLDRAGGGVDRVVGRQQRRRGRARSCRRWQNAMTGSLPRAIAALICGRSSCGSGEHHRDRLDLGDRDDAALASAAWTKLPGSTWRSPTRPSIGA